jgi:hypothetical protein
LPHQALLSVQEPGVFHDEEFVQAFALINHDGRVRMDKSEVADVKFVPFKQVSCFFLDPMSDTQAKRTTLKFVSPSSRIKSMRTCVGIGFWSFEEPYAW